MHIHPKGVERMSRELLSRSKAPDVCHVVGARFVVHAEYCPGPVVGEHPLDVSSFPVAKVITRILRRRGELSEGVPVRVYPADVATITDKPLKRSIDLLRLLPRQYRAELVELTPDAVEVVQLMGCGTLPIVFLPDVKAIRIPVYCFYQDGMRADLTAERLLYTIGLSRASARGEDPAAYARNFLRDALGRKLLTDV